MAWAVPGPFSRVPLKLAAQVGTAGRGFVEDSLLVLVTSIPFEADSYNAAVPFLQIHGTEGQMEGPLCKGNHAFAQIRQKAWEGCPYMEPLGTKEFCVWAFQAANQVPYNHGGQHGGGHPPFFEPGCNIPVGPEHGISSNERDVIMGHAVLGRPPGNDPAVRVILFCRLFQALVFPARCGNCRQGGGRRVSI